MRRSTRAAYVAVIVSPAIIACGGSLKAQSLTDNLAGPASKVAAVGDWTTVMTPDPPKSATFDHWQAKVVLTKPSFHLAKKQLPASASVLAERPYALHGPLPAAAGPTLNGLASFYGKGERTATGEIFNPEDMTAAHRTLPFGTRVRVTRVDNGESVVVRINDRGPFKPGRVIDLSRKAAENLRMTDRGLAAVKLEVLDREDGPLADNAAQRSLRR